MIKNKFGEIVYNIEDVVDLIMKQQTTAGITVDSTVQLNNTSPETDISLSVDEYDMMNQQNWLMPEEYKRMDIAKHVIDLCKTTQLISSLLNTHISLPITLKSYFLKPPFCKSTILRLNSVLFFLMSALIII